MDALKILYQISDVEKLINENLENLVILHERKNNLPSAGADVSSGNSSDKATAYAKAIEQIEAVEIKILKQNQEYAELLSKTIQMVNRIDNLEYRLILQKKLFARKTFSKIAKELFCDESTVKRKYTKALDEFKRINKDAPNCT